MRQAMRMVDRADCVICNQVPAHWQERDIGIPTLYLMGEEGHMFLPAARRLAERQRQAVCWAIERASHVCNIDGPDQFNRLSLAFLRDPVAATTQ